MRILFHGVIVSTQWSYNVVRGLILTEIKTSNILFKRPKNVGGHLGPLPRLFFFPKLLDQNFEIAVLFKLVENLITMSLETM